MNIIHVGQQEAYRLSLFTTLSLTLSHQTKFRLSTQKFGIRRLLRQEFEWTNKVLSLDVHVAN